MFFYFKEIFIYLFVNLKLKLLGCIHEDCTYKNIQLGYSVFVIGKTDAKHQFHPIAIGSTSHEQTPDMAWFYAASKKICKRLGINMGEFHLMTDASD